MATAPKRGVKIQQNERRCVALLIYEEKPMKKWMGFQWV